MMRILNAENLLFRAVQSGELDVDAQGRVWRVGCRRGSRWTGQSQVIPCAPRRAEVRVRSGYLQVRNTVDGQRVYGMAARLVWRVFHGPILAGLTINHRNGKKDDNRPANLELMTPSQQTAHAREVLGRQAPLAKELGEKHHAAKLTDGAVREIRRARAAGTPLLVLAGRYGVTKSTISRIAARRTWRHVTD